MIFNMCADPSHTFLFRGLHSGDALPAALPASPLHDKAPKARPPRTPPRAPAVNQAPRTRSPRICHLPALLLPLAPLRPSWALPLLRHPEAAPGPGRGQAVPSAERPLPGTPCGSHLHLRQVSVRPTFPVTCHLPHFAPPTSSWSDD